MAWVAGLGDAALHVLGHHDEAVFGVELEAVHDHLPGHVLHVVAPAPPTTRQTRVSDQNSLINFLKNFEFSSK